MKTTRNARRHRLAYHHEPLEFRRLLSTVSWVATTGGSWSTAGDWSDDAIPPAGSDVVIDQPGNIQVSLVGSSSINSLSVTGDTLADSGGTLSVVGAVSIKTGASLTLASGTLGSGVGDNLLSNAGFESPAAAGSTTAVPDVWGQWGNAYVSTAEAHSGSQSLLEDGSNSGVFQSFAVSPGVSYSASVYALTPASSPLTGAQGAFAALSFSNSAGGTISSPSDWITALNSKSAPGDWIRSTASIVAPATAVKITIDLQVGAYTGLSGTSGGLAYFDDVQLGPTAVNSTAVTAASVTNSGTIKLGAGDSITTTGSFTQTSAGDLITQLGGPASGNLFGSVTAGGAVSLAGAFQASLTGGYAPSINDGFTILSYPSATGSFATYQLPSGSSYQFEAGTNPTYFGISAVPGTLSATVSALTAISSSTNNLVGVDLAYWDDLLTTSQTQQMVKAAGLSLFRFPGGSGSDDYHFNVAANYGDPAAITIPQFAQFITEVGGTGIVTTDYGSGSPQEAEAELAYLEGSATDTTVIGTGIEWSDSAGAWQDVNWQTVGYWASLRAATPLATNDGLNFLRIGQAAPFTDIPYWEMGNEEYGSWEVDHHGTAGPGGVSTGAQHDPATYAAYAAAFAGFVAADPMLPAVQIGIDSGDPTGASDNNWTRNVVTDLHNDGFAPGFISDHSYMQAPGTESDSFLLNDTVSDPSSTLDWSTRYADYESMLQQVLGSQAGSVKVMATEYNSNYGTEGKQMTSLVNGLFVADSIGSLLDSGYSGGVFWDLRNGWTTDGNNSPLLYGWREGGDEGLIGTSGDNDSPVTGPYIAYPDYFGEQLASQIMQTGGVGLPVVSSYSELTVYSVLEPNGDLDLMVLNKNPDAALTDQFNLSGFVPSGQARIWQYGEAQDYAQSQSSTGAAALAYSTTSLSLTGTSFSYSFPAYSMTVIDLASAPSLDVTSGTETIPAGTGSGINLQVYSSVTIAAGASLVVAPSTSSADRTLLDIQSLTIAGSAGNWTGKLDLNNNDLMVQNGNLATINNQVAQGYMYGSGGIISSMAAANSTHLTALGVILNSVNGTTAGAPLYSSSNPFDGTSPPASAVLVKYTYYGDTNLDGKVDASDYSRIDNGYLNQLTGWFNGDFNYDGVVNGSDYTLIDNAFNMQGAALTDSIAAARAESRTASQVLPSSLAVFQTQAPITLTGPMLESIEDLMQKKDLVDALTATG